MARLSFSFLKSRPDFVIRRLIGNQAAITTAMKLTVAFFAVIVTLGFTACSSTQVASKEVTFIPCCMTDQPSKVVILQDSWQPGGTVVRLVH